MSIPRVVFFAEEYRFLKAAVSPESSELGLAKEASAKGRFDTIPAPKEISTRKTI